MKIVVDGCGCFPTGKHYAGIAHLIRIQAIGVVEGFQGEANWVDLPIAVIDVETTGRDAAVDRVVEIGIVVGRSGEVIERRSWLVNPGVPIPDEAREVHGITDEMVADKPAFAAIAEEVIAAIGGAIPGAYNAAFDRGFLLGELERAGFGRDFLPASLATSVEWFDPLVWARELHEMEKSKSLGEVTARLGIALETAHRATDDAEAALMVLYAFSGDVRVPKSYAGFAQEQRRLMRLQDEERNRFWRTTPTATPPTKPS
ncbi:MAG TPA: 3'-5' exonuclease [Polyangiaceae bacterium]|nr:3'-5' exonuclease [Polyangiaceae bacterium]